MLVEKSSSRSVRVPSGAFKIRAVPEVPCSWLTNAPVASSTFFAVADAGPAAGAGSSTVESVKAASGVYMPLAGEVLEVNDKLDGSPELVNEDPMGEGWFFRFKPADASAVAKLLDQDAYDRLIKANAEA